MTSRQVALIRGINVGRAKRVAMSDLRELMEGLGYGAARTVLNSGNVASRLPGVVGRTLGETATTRNWSTVGKIHALL